MKSLSWMYFPLLCLSSLPRVKESEAGVSHNNGDDDSDNSPDELVRVTEEPKEKWDCESILSESMFLFVGIIAAVCVVEEWMRQKIFLSHTEESLGSNGQGVQGSKAGYKPSPPPPPPAPFIGEMTTWE